MQVSLETTSGLERKLTVGIPADQIDSEVQKRLSEAAKTVRINGFRKGKVPIKVVKQRFGAGVRQEVIGDAINRSYSEAIQQEAVRPAGQPSIEPTQLDEGKDVEYVATFEVFPEFELKGLDDIQVTQYSAEIVDADIDTMIENLRKSNAVWESAERDALDGDRVDIDFAGTKDGEAFEGGSAEGHQLVLGSNTMIPGFESGIVGMKIGEDKTLSLSFPEDYQVDELKGAAVEFKIHLNAIEEQKLPALDDEFYKKFGVTEGGEDKFRSDVRDNMEREKQKSIKTKTRDQVMNALLSANSIDLPKALVDGEINALRNQMVQQYGASVEKLDVKTLLPDDMFKEQAERRTTLSLIISEYVKQKDIKADKDVVKSLIEETASTYEDPQEVINYYYSNEQMLANVEAAAIEEQVITQLVDSAKVKEEVVSYEEVLKPLEVKAEADS